MRLTSQIFALTVAAVLLVIAVPYSLVQLDVMRAGNLRLVPSAIAIVIACAFIATALRSKRRGKKS